MTTIGWIATYCVLSCLSVPFVGALFQYGLGGQETAGPKGAEQPGIASVTCCCDDSRS